MSLMSEYEKLRKKRKEQEANGVASQKSVGTTNTESNKTTSTSSSSSLRGEYSTLREQRKREEAAKAEQDFAPVRDDISTTGTTTKTLSARERKLATQEKRLDENYEITKSDAYKAVSSLLGDLQNNSFTTNYLDPNSSLYIQQEDGTVKKNYVDPADVKDKYGYTFSDYADFLNYSTDLTDAEKKQIYQLNQARINAIDNEIAQHQARYDKSQSEKSATNQNVLTRIQILNNAKQVLVNANSLYDKNEASAKKTSGKTQSDVLTAITAMTNSAEIDGVSSFNNKDKFGMSMTDYGNWMNYSAELSTEERKAIYKLNQARIKAYDKEIETAKKTGNGNVEVLESQKKLLVDANAMYDKWGYLLDRPAKELYEMAHAVEDENTSDYLYLLGLANNKNVVEHENHLKKVKMPNEDVSVYDAAQEVAKMEDGDEKSARVKQVEAAMEKAGVSFDDWYSLITGDGNISPGNLVSWAGNTTGSGWNSFNEGVTGFLDWVLGEPLKEFGWENNPISEAHEYFEDEGERFAFNQEYYKNIMGGGKGFDFAGQLLSGVAGAVPHAALTWMTAGASAGSSSASLSSTATMNTATTAQKAGMVAQNLVKNPQWQMSFVQESGSNYYDAIEAGATPLEATTHALLTGTANATIETGLTGESGFQGVAQNLNKGSGVWKAIKDASWQEGMEEVLQGTISRASAKDLYGADEEVYDLETMLKEGLIGSTVGAALGGGQATVQTAVNAHQQHKLDAEALEKFRNLTDTEKKVVDKVFEAELSAKKEDGETLTEKQKTALYDNIIEQMDKGYISIDAIEETLGGDTYTQLQELTKQEEADIARFEEMYEGEELQKRIDDYLSESKKGELETQLSDEVYNLVENSRLAESYNEQTRKGFNFTVDEETMSRYGKKYRDTYQRAMDSGVLNNTRRSHELVDIVAKLEADKGAKFDFTDNDGLAEMGFSVEGATINGVVDADGNVKLNVQSKKYLNTVAGHEIAHVLEGTELYETFKNAVFEYAKAKGEYDSRYKAIDSLYSNKEGYKGQEGQRKIENELAADLAGDYLFTDADFIKNLSVKHRNVFQKIYDEIKYLCKIATAGSTEARQLERVKKAFEDAYRADTVKTDGETKLSLSENNADSDGKQLTEGQREYFKDSKMRDDNGNLKVMYHGSQDAGFHVFDSNMSDDGTSFFFVDRNDVAASYSGTTETYEAQTIRTAEDMNRFLESIGYDHYTAVEKNGKFELLENNEHVATSDTAQGLYEEFCWYEGVGDGDANYKVYLNLTNPLEIDAEGRNWNNIGREFSQELADQYNSLTAEEKAALVDLAEWGDFQTFRDEILSVLEQQSIAPIGENYQTLANAVNKLGGNNINISNLFSIASDNFSAESINEFAVKQMNTRDYAQLAKEQGYDGVIFKNIHDNGGYSNGSEGASTVAIAFDSNQIKSVANENPTGNKDIRYSLSEQNATPKRYGNFNISGEDVRLWNENDYAPVAEDVAKNATTNIAPVAETVQESTETVQNTEENLQNRNWRDVLDDFREPTDADIDEDGSWTEEYLNYHNQVKTAIANASVNEVIHDVESGMTSADLMRMSLIAMRQYEQVQKRAGTRSYTEAEQIKLTTLYNLYTLYDSVARNPAFVNELKGVLADDIAPLDLEAQTAMDMERLNSLDDSDMPPVPEAPYYEEDTSTRTPSNPFDKRNYYSDLSKVTPFTEEHPEVAHLFKKVAQDMLYDVKDSTRGKRYTVGDYESGTLRWTGEKRNTTADIEKLLDGRYHYSYAQIEDALQRIINGEKYNTLAKRLEWDLHDRLVNGYTTLADGLKVAPNQEYIDLLNQMQTMDEAYQQHLDSMEYMDDSFAPIAEDVATPVQNATSPIMDAPVMQPETAAPVNPNPEEGRNARVLTEEPEAVTEERSLWQMFMRNFVDKKSVFEKLSLKTGNRELQARADSLHRADSSAQYFMKNGNETAGVKSLVDMRKEVQESGKEQEFSDYVYHVHNIDRMSLESRVAPRLAELKQTLEGLTDEQIQELAKESIKVKTPADEAAKIKAAKEYAYLSNVKNKPVFGEYTAEDSRGFVAEFEQNNPEFKEWAQDLYNYSNYLRDMMIENGIISQETADLWQSLYPHYVPIRRVGHEGAAINVALDTNKTGINAPIKRATGGNADILPLFDTLGARTVQTFNAVAKNRFGVELKNTLKSTIAEADTTLDDATEGVENHEGWLQEGKDGMNPTFTVFEDGKRVTFEISKDMFDAMKPTSEGLSKKWLKGIPNKISNFRRGVLTEYNPYFLLTNAAKDVQDVLVNSQHPARTYANLPVALKEILSNGKYYQEYLENGGDQVSYFERETNTFEKEKSTLRKVVGFPLDMIAKANNVVERLPRLAEYIASRKAGRSIDISMLDSARVTTNFAAGGDVTKALNRNGFTFLNASVQGAAQQVRNIREAKHKGLRGWVGLAAKYTIAGLPALLLNSMLWGDDDDYEELSDYVKQDYYIVGKNADGTFIRIPKGRTVSVIQNAFEQIGNLITGDDEADFGQFFDLVINNLAPNNPIDNNIISPIAQAWSGTTWYGDDLVPSRLQDLPAEEQYDESTDAISKWLGEATGISPYKINYLLDQYSGVIGDAILPTLTPDAERGDGNIITSPFLDKFTTDPVMKNQNVSDFYTKMDELTVNANGSKATDDDILKSKYFNSINSELSELYAQKREIQNDTTLSDEEKYAEVRAIQQQIVDKTKEGLDNYENIQYEGNGDYAVIGDTYFQWYTPESGDPYWRKLSEDQTVKYNLTKNATGKHYVTDGNVHYRLNEEGEWTKISDKQLQRQKEVTKALGITPEEYWRETEISVMPMSNGEYEYAYDNPENYAVAKAVGGYDKFRTYSNELYDIKADKDSNGKSISGSRKEKVIDYINDLDADYGEKIILFKSEYPSDDTYNYDIIDYLNGRDDISYSEMETILKKLGFTVDEDGNIFW